MLRIPCALMLLVFSLASPAWADVPATLRGSPSSMVRQNEVAKEKDYTFLRTPAQVKEFVKEGYLVRLEGNANYRVVDGVSFPFARPEMRAFVERLGAQHRASCGEPLVVTSLTRPLSVQPRNAHQLSVHPTGMAVDLRVLRNETCRRWLEETLLSLEKEGLLDVTREQRPPHYHVALFPDAYREHVEQTRADSLALAAAEEAATLAATIQPVPSVELPVVAAAFVPAAVAPAATAPEEDNRFLLGAILLVMSGMAVNARLRRAKKA